MFTNVTRIRIKSSSIAIALVAYSVASCEFRLV